MVGRCFGRLEGGDERLAGIVGRLVGANGRLAGRRERLAGGNGYFVQELDDLEE